MIHKVFIGEFIAAGIHVPSVTLDISGRAFIEIIAHFPDFAHQTASNPCFLGFSPKN
jgi:hypothetical protein